MEQFIFFSVIVLWCLSVVNFFMLFLLFRQFGEIYLSSSEGIANDGIKIGSTIPKDRIYSIKENQPIHLHDHIQNPSLLVFVSTKCKPCQELLKEWNSALENSEDHIDFVLIFIGDKELIDEMITQNQPKGLLLWDKNENILRHFKVRVTPFAFAITKIGIVKDKGLCGTKEQMDAYVQSLLREKM